MSTMKTLAFLAWVLAFTGSAMAEDAINLAGTIKGAKVAYTRNSRERIARKSVDLLASCIYMNPRPNWGASSTAPPGIENARKQSHLDLVFSTPQKVEVAAEKVTLDVKELVITLPLNSGGIWVRTDDGVKYFAKFDCIVSHDLQKLLSEAQKP